MGQTWQSSLKDRQRQRCRSEASFVLDPVLQHGCTVAMGGGSILAGNLQQTYFLSKWLKISAKYVATLPQ